MKAAWTFWLVSSITYDWLARKEQAIFAIERSQALCIERKRRSLARRFACHCKHFGAEAGVPALVLQKLFKRGLGATLETKPSSQRVSDGYQDPEAPLPPGWEQHWSEELPQPLLSLPEFLLQKRRFWVGAEISLLLRLNLI